MMMISTGLGEVNVCTSVEGVELKLKLGMLY